MKKPKVPLLVPEESSKLYKNLSENNDFSDFRPTNAQQDRRKCFNAISYIIMGLTLLLVTLLGALLYIYFEEIQLMLSNH